MRRTGGRGPLGLFIHPAPGGDGTGTGWVDRTFPFRRGGRPRNGVRMDRGPVRQSGQVRSGGSTAQRLLALPRRSRHEKRGLHCSRLYIYFFHTAFLLCRPARPTRGTAVGLEGWPLVWWGVGGPVLAVARDRAPCRCSSPAPLNERREYIQFWYPDLIDHLACPQLLLVRSQR